MLTETPSSSSLPTSSPHPTGHDARPSADSSGPSALQHKIPTRRPAASTGHGLEGATSVFPTHLFDRPTSVFVYGPSRPLVNLVIFALAEATSPDFQWLDIGVQEEERIASDPVRLGWVPEERLWRVDRPDMLRPDDTTANLALFGLIRSDEPPATLTHIAEFLRLPEISQRILSRRPPDGKPGALAVTNAHRVIAAYPPNRVPPILALHRDAGFTVLVGFADVAGPGRNVFDFVFHLDCENLADWKKSHLVCERGIASGPLGNARPMTLESIPLLANVVGRAPTSR